MLIIYISTHGSAREPTMIQLYRIGLRLQFQLTAPRGSRLDWLLKVGKQADISTHGSAREPTGIGDIIGFYSYISTHGSAREPTNEKEQAGVFHVISTHGSAREPTAVKCCYCLVISISTHGSAREPTSSFFGSIYHSRYFNSRLREGADNVWSNVNSRTVISTHGSAREPTFLLQAGIALSCIFQLTAPRGSRRLTRIMKNGHIYFNSRLREGADDLAIFSGMNSSYFNSRLREGADFSLNQRQSLYYNFNSRLREGADSRNSMPWPVHFIFQLTAPRGSRRYETCLFRWLFEISTHGSAREPTMQLQN